MMLLVIIGITLTNKNFPTVYSFVKREIIMLFNFLFNSFKHFVFGNNIAEPRVILADQAAGLIAAMSLSILNYLL
jgi:hypothetical protein